MGEEMKSKNNNDQKCNNQWFVLCNKCECNISIIIYKFL